MDLSGLLEFAGLTNRGLVRDHNEDCIAFNTELGLAVVADGMGGYQAGEVASAITIKSVMAHAEDNLTRVASLPDDPETGLTPQSIMLRDAIRKANHVIFRASQTQPQCAGMGTTVVAAIFHGDRVSIAHVGDSRLYRVRNKRIEQITTDHSLLAELVARGFYTPEEAKKSLNKNLVTRALGIGKKVEVTVAEELVLPGDTYLLCSDGLSDMVEDTNIGLTISNFGANLHAAAEQLVQLANDNGGRDNISAVLVQALTPPRTRKRWLNRVTDWFG